MGGVTVEDVRATALVVLVLALLAGCSSSGKPGGGVVTITRTRVPPAGHSPTARTTSAAPKPVHQTKLPGTCYDLLSDGDVAAAIHVARFGGADAFVVGVPEADIGRIGYLNCRYGVTGRGAAATAKVEIGVSLYRTPELAAKRIKATIDDYGAHGARSAPVKVGALTGTQLTGGAGSGYNFPLLVVGSGQRTVAVDIAPSFASGAKETADAIVLANLALQRTSG